MIEIKSIISNVAVLLLLTCGYGMAIVILFSILMYMTETWFAWAMSSLIGVVVLIVLFSVGHSMYIEICNKREVCDDRD